jgi:hypothetical protein
MSLGLLCLPLGFGQSNALAPQSQFHAVKPYFTGSAYIVSTESNAFLVRPTKLYLDPCVNSVFAFLTPLTNTVSKLIDRVRRKFISRNTLHATHISYRFLSLSSFVWSCILSKRLDCERNTNVPVAAFGISKQDGVD